MGAGERASWVGAFRLGFRRLSRAMRWRARSWHGSAPHTKRRRKGLERWSRVSGDFERRSEGEGLLGHMATAMKAMRDPAHSLPSRAYMYPIHMGIEAPVMDRMNVFAAWGGSFSSARRGVAK